MLDALADEMNQRNLFYSGHHATENRCVRDEFARPWRDRKRAIDRFIDGLREGEGVTVRP